MDERAVYFLAEKIGELATATELCVEQHAKVLEVSKDLGARHLVIESNIALIEARLNGEVAQKATEAERAHLRPLLEQVGRDIEFLSRAFGFVEPASIADLRRGLGKEG